MSKLDELPDPASGAFKPLPTPAASLAQPSGSERGDTRRGRDLVDLSSGLLLIFIGLLGLWLTWPLQTGTAARMGPGYLPQLTCYLLVALGALILASGYLAGSRQLERWVLRPQLWIYAGLASFALTIDRLGLVVAVALLVLLSCVANRGTRTLAAVLLAVGLATFSALVFVIALGLPIPIWPRIGN